MSVVPRRSFSGTSAWDRVLALLRRELDVLGSIREKDLELWWVGDRSKPCCAVPGEEGMGMNIAEYVS